MRPRFGDLAGLDGDDAVALPHRRQAVGDDDHGAPLRDARQVILDDLFAFGVQRRGRFVEDQDTRIVDQRAGNGDALALAARQVAAALVDDRVIAVGELEDELMCASQLRPPPSPPPSDVSDRPARYSRARCG